MITLPQVQQGALIIAYRIVVLSFYYKNTIKFSLLTRGKRFAESRPRAGYVVMWVEEALGPSVPLGPNEAKCSTTNGLPFTRVP